MTAPSQQRLHLRGWNRWFTVIAFWFLLWAAVPALFVWGTKPYVRQASFSFGGKSHAELEAALNKRYAVWLRSAEAVVVQSALAGRPSQATVKPSIVAPGAAQEVWCGVGGVTGTADGMLARRRGDGRVFGEVHTGSASSPGPHSMRRKGNERRL